MRHEAQIRLLLLQQYLLEHTDEQHSVSVSDILIFWEQHGIQAGRKSVYSDIEILQNGGMDIICVKSTQNRYFIGCRLFELPELKLLVDAVESSHFITAKKSEVLIEKLGHLASTAQAKVLKHDGYRYVFSPYAMIWNRDYYYVVGWSEKHEKLAQFRVDRITAIEHLNSGYIEDEAFNPATYVQEVFGMYNDDTCAVKLLCHNSTMRNVIDRFGEDVDTSPVDAEHFRVTVNVAPSPPFFSWVFTFGGCIQIEGPDSVLEEMRQMAKWLST